MKPIENLFNRCQSPYSKIKVVSTLHTPDKIYQGVNVESASYGLTMCAERNAIFSAISQGADLSTVKQIHIYSNLDNITPCGACRQIMSEYLLPQTEVICHQVDRVDKFKVKELLPMVFKC